MKASYIIDALKKLPPDTQVFMSVDEEGNAYHKEFRLEAWEGFDDDMLKAAGLTKKDPTAYCIYPWGEGFDLC